jgi:hypothetical protein
MKPSNYNTYTTSSNPYSAQNLAKTYLERKIPLSLNITEENFEDVAEAVYDLCHLAGDELRGGKGRAGGGREDIRVALSIAADIEIDVDFWSVNARNFKNSMTQKLQNAFKNDDVATLVYIMCGLERNAATAIVDHRDNELVAEISFIEIFDLCDDEEREELVVDMVEELVMSANTVHRRKFGGNEHKVRSKPATRSTKQLVMEL